MIRFLAAAFLLWAVAALYTRIPHPASSPPGEG